MPDARCTRSLACSKKTRELVTTGSPESPGIPCAMVLTVSFVLSPVIGLLSPSPPRSLLLKNLTPASRRQDHTTSPSASAPFVFARRSRPSHPAPNVRDDRDTPLVSAKSARMSERAVLQNRPSLELSPLRPKGGRAW
jgi:hypothetical protein